MDKASKNNRADKESAAGIPSKRNIPDAGIHVLIILALFLAGSANWYFLQNLEKTGSPLQSSSTGIPTGFVTKDADGSFELSPQVPTRVDLVAVYAPFVVVTVLALLIVSGLATYLVRRS